ncbi:ABC transporter permease subunit [Pseudomonas syringae pv. tagetis]|uniref:ABC transporter permease subunit n=1 Tax=Pseudomonas syringae pv. tagetis TaxID=129140 RepID=A0A0N8T4S9_9PSED|nr:ABC transporter permease subunit [Pseudomonas syringae group genomosp. 7]KPY89240.1 ABC-type proline/glycine betaine transport system, permease component [Pseudomonas syringae pv. tagetis]RMW16506.1 ABC-type proline/glycine betaine transport system [Pseudomonas syringae pv. tagetis]UNB66530.1 ABC transporter permease subunit [Pseudomonas syringae pv. tagetis]
MIDGAWIVENWQQIGLLLIDHIQMVTLALCTGVLLAGAMVLLTLWQPGLARPMIYTCGLLFTIPSLALFILIMPFTGLSKTTAVIGLSLYALLIVLQNTLAGLASLPADVVEEARALGYTRMQRFLGVELPLALPALLAGLRTTSVTLVGLVTVTALIGQGGLGQLFITGLAQSFTTPVAVSPVLTVILALCFDFLFYSINKWLVPWVR